MPAQGTEHRAMPDRPAPEGALVEIADFVVREMAKGPRKHELRAPICCIGDVGFSRDDLDPERASMPSALTVRFRVGGSLPQIGVANPRDYRRWCGEGRPRPIENSRMKLDRVLSAPRTDTKPVLCLRQAKRLPAKPLDAFVDRRVTWRKHRRWMT